MSRPYSGDDEGVVGEGRLTEGNAWVVSDKIVTRNESRTGNPYIFWVPMTKVVVDRPLSSTFYRLVGGGAAYLRVVDSTTLDEIHHAIGEHFSVDTEVLVVLQALQDAIRNVTNTDLGVRGPGSSIPEGWSHP